MLRSVPGNARVAGNNDSKPAEPGSRAAPPVLTGGSGNPAPPPETGTGNDLRLPPSQNSGALTGHAFSYRDFTRQLALQPGATGAIAPSSKSLAKKTIDLADIQTAGTVVELGPGTGVFTEEILHHIRCDQTFFAIEVNPIFVNATQFRCPDACVHHDAASALPSWLEKHHCTHADRIIASLPWTIFDKPEQKQMMEVISDSLAEDGVFVSIVYLGAKFRTRGRYFINNLQHHFSSVTRTPTVWQNLPPTQIFRCVK